MSGAADLKRRGLLMAAICGVAFLAAIAGFVSYFQFGQGWGRWIAVAALAIGFGGQIWLIVSLRRDARRV